MTLDRKVIRETLAGYARASEFTEAERRSAQEYDGRGVSGDLRGPCRDLGGHATIGER